MTRQRSLSGTIPSMETSHDELKDNTIIVGMSPSDQYTPHTNFSVHLTVLGASGDLAKKKVADYIICRLPLH